MLLCGSMSDGPRGKARRLGDATRARINDLKGGWELPDQGKPTVIPSDNSPRRKGPTSHPPPEGRKKGPTRPPPLPGGSASAAGPPPLKKRSAPVSMPPPAVVIAEGVDDDATTTLTSRDAPARLPAAPALASENATGTVRLPDSLPRNSGIGGDVAYLFRVWTRSRSCKVELAQIATQIASEKEARNLKLLQKARQAIGDDRNDQTLVGRARADLLKIEERRSVHAGRVAAADEKMAALARHRHDKRNLRVEEAEAMTDEVDAINTSLEPLQTRTSDARKRTTNLRKQLQALDEEIRQQEASLIAVTGPADKAAVHAALASLRAERDTVAADEPMLAAEIDDLEPKISSLISTRSALSDKIVALDQERSVDELRVKEKEDAVKASRTVESRAVDDQASKRQNALLELGEALHSKPEGSSTPRASTLENHELEIGTLERRRLELKELMSGVEYLPMVRGGLWLFLLVALIGAVFFFALTL